MGALVKVRGCARDLHSFVSLFYFVAIVCCCAGERVCRYRENLILTLIVYCEACVDGLCSLQQVKLQTLLFPLFSFLSFNEKTLQ